MRSNDGEAPAEAAPRAGTVSAWPGSHVAPALVPVFTHGEPTPAYYRMTAAGLIRKYPELVEPLRDGRLHLTSVTQLARVITPENRAEVLPRFFHLSKRGAKEVVAELVPAAALPIRTVVTPVRCSAPQAPTSPLGLEVLPVCNRRHG
jgi:hypothetical protein